MRDEIAFTVVGVPQPKGSARAFWSPKHAKVITWADNRERLKPWEDVVRGAALRARGRSRQPWSGLAVTLEVTFVFARPVSSRASEANRPHHIVKPDLSKLIRGLEDALTGVLYRDDAEIAHVIARKVYEGPTASSRAEVRAWVER